MAFGKFSKDKVKVQSVAKYSQSKKIGFLLAGVILVVVIINFISSYALRQTIDVVKLKASVPQDGVILTENIVKDSMLKAEYEKQGLYKLSDGTQKRAIVLWDDRNKIVNTYASYYIRQNTPVYWDSISKETPKKYSYLYKMDGELLKLDIKADQFGEMLVPGDRINVRASFTEQNFTLPSEQDFMLQQQIGIQSQTSVQKQIKLFNNTSVLDILNSKGESIFDIYYQLLALPKAQQRTSLASKDFQESVKPAQILLNVTPEEADMYMAIQNKGPNYMMTLLPRTSSNLITEALNELQTGFARSN